MRLSLQSGKEIPFDRSHGGAADLTLLDFSASINPLGPPPEAIDAFHAAAASIERYPEPYASSVIAGLGKWLGVDRANILAGNGSTQLFFLLVRVLRPRRPFVAIPTFSEIANALLIAGVPARAIALHRERGFELEPDDVHGALADGADAVFIGRPNSPTGSMLGLDAAAEIARDCAARRCWCVFDEAFIDFAGNGHSAVALVGSNPWVIVMRSLTKIFAIPGLRFGYVVACKDLIARLAHDLEPWSVNCVAQRVASACLESADAFCARVGAMIEAEGAYLSSGLSSLRGFRVFDSAANFLMIEVRDEPVSSPLARHMLERGIAIRDLRELPGCEPGFYRIAVRLRSDNERLLDAAAIYAQQPITHK